MPLGEPGGGGEHVSSKITPGGGLEDGVTAVGQYLSLCPSGRRDDCASRSLGKVTDGI